MNDSTKVRRAECSCGALNVTVTGDPVRISMCHCLACQKRTGSLFGAQARWPRERAVIAGASTEFARVGDEGGTARFHFCAVCGSTVWYTMDAMPGMIAVPIGAFADPGFPMPSVSVYGERKHRWLQLPDDMQHDF
jgi:hypothetical protein